MTALPVQASLISEQAVLNHILNRYAFEHPVTCRFHQHGVNDTYRVADGNHCWYLRIYTPSYADQTAIGREIDLLIGLEKKGVSVGTPVVDRKHRYIQPVNAAEGQRYAVLFTGTKGCPIDIKVKDQVQAFGAWTAAFHNASDDLDLPGVRAPLNTQRLLWHDLDLFLPRLEHRPADATFAKNLAEYLAEHLEALQQNTRDIGVIHGDLHSGNCTYHSDTGIHAFDFADSGIGWRLYDLSVFLQSVRARVPQKRLRTRIWTDFIRGYRQQRKLGRDTLDQALVFVILKQFWLLGFHATMCNRHGESWMNDNYYDAAFTSMKQLTEELGIANLGETA